MRASTPASPRRPKEKQTRKSAPSLDANLARNCCGPEGGGGSRFPGTAPDVDGPSEPKAPAARDAEDEVLERF